MTQIKPNRETLNCLPNHLRKALVKLGQNLSNQVRFLAARSVEDYETGEISPDQFEVFGTACAKMFNDAAMVMEPDDGERDTDDYEGDEECQ